MATRLELARFELEYACQIVKNHLARISLHEALFVPQGGYRSALGTLKHAAAWSHVYRSFAFDAEPRHWRDIQWPRGRRDTIEKSEEYLQDVIAWFDEAHHLWMSDMAGLKESQLDELRPLHWGERAPLREIVTRTAAHNVYHAGELNQLLSICRGEAWEEGEEVEENNIATDGHRVRPPWLDIPST